LNDEQGLYQILGDAIIAFMRIKPEPFLSGALLSQDHFWRVPPWKRAVTAVFMLRFVLGYRAQSQWKKFTSKDYKLNKRSFQRWLQKESEIFEQSEELAKLPEHFDSPAKPNKKKRKLKSDSELSTDSPMKRHFVVADESTSDSE